MLPNLYIDLDIVAYNYGLCQSLVSSAQISAVIKNNAYGLGAREVAQKLYQEKNCRIFFVSYASEGVIVRSVAPNATIYLLNGFDTEDITLIKQFNLIPVLSSLEQCKQWEKSELSTIRPALQVESGLHRLGVSYEQAQTLSEEQRNRFCLILSHLACADEANNPLNKKQQQEFLRFKSLFPKSLFSLSASDGLGLGSDFYFDIVRVGAFMYGLKTCPPLNSQQKQAVRAEVSVLQFKQVQINDSAGYNQTFTAQRPTSILALSVGYADGLLRSLSNKGYIFFYHNDQWLKAPIIGRISMDITLCDITNLPKEISSVKKAFLLNDIYTFDDMGKDAGTIGYEALSLLCNSIRWQKKYTSDT